MAKSEIIELLKRYVILLNTEGFSVHKAYLFGSFSNDTATSESDIDVMLVSDKYGENDDAMIGKMWKLTRKINSRIEPFLISESTFENNQASPLVSVIKEKGILI